MTPASHYEQAERLLAAAESSRTAEMQTSDALIALGHAVLATAPKRRSRRRDLFVDSSNKSSGGSPRQRWLHGKDDEGSTTP